MTIRVVVALLLLVSTSACTSTPFNYVAETRQVSYPPIGEVITAHVGDVMVRQGFVADQEALLILEEIKVGSGIAGYAFSSGYYPKIGQDEESSFYKPDVLQNTPNMGHYRSRGIPDPFLSIQVYANEKKLCGVSTLGTKACTDKGQYQVAQVSQRGLNSFQQTLIYSGKVGNKINIGYREFSSDFARPAFNNDVEYDLEESNIIGYKGAEIEILEADNRKIVYRLIKNFLPTEQDYNNHRKITPLTGTR